MASLKLASVMERTDPLPTRPAVLQEFDSASTPELTQPSSAGAGGGPGASTGSLFDLEAKNDK
jgi:hypothetical protein